MELCFGVSGQREVGHSGQHLFDADPELEAREIGAEATVHAGAESQVPVRSEERRVGKECRL